MGKAKIVQNQFKQVFTRDKLRFIAQIINTAGYLQSNMQNGDC